MRIAIDSNVLIYAEGFDDEARMRRAQQVLRRIPPTHGVVPVQVLGECYGFLVRKRDASPTDAQKKIEEWSQVYEPYATSERVFLVAVEIAARHRLQIWDSVILAASADAKCSILLSEDMQDGFRWQGTTIVNPFAAPEHPLLSAALDPA